MADLKNFSLTSKQKTIAAVCAVLLLIGCFLYHISSVLLPFVLAFVFAYLLHPFVLGLEKKGMPRWLATSCIMTLFLLFILGVVFIVVPILQAQVFVLLSKVPVIIQTLWGHLQSLIVYTKENVTQAQLSELSSAVSKNVFAVLNSVISNVFKVVSGGMVLFNVVSMFMITPIILFYVLRDWKGVENQVSEFIPNKNKKEIAGLWREINTTLSGFIRGQSTVCLLLGLYYAVGLTVVGLESGFLVGFLAGILSFIPYFGFLTGVVLSVIIGITMHATSMVWFGLIVVFALGQILEGYVLTPKLVGGKVGLHPVWVIFALFAGGALFGFVGILIAVPVAAVIGVLIRRFLKWYHSTGLYKGKKNHQ